MEIGIGLGITRFPGWGVMNIGQLFASGEQGAWYDPSDMSTLFQDAAGTTPVTAVEQPVGRILDKSGRGNHATQSTTTKRPVLSRRVNALLATTTLATQSVTTLAAAYRLVFSGAGSLTLSGTASGVYGAGTHAITCTAGSLTLTVSGTVQDASLTLATDAHLPYQRVNTPTDYDADPAKFPAYLGFDGVDDALQTSNIDFTGTDKMTVWAGVTKMLPSGFGMLYELGNVDATNGSVSLLDPYGNAGTGYFARGTVLAFRSVPISAPATYIATSVVNLAGATRASSIAARRDGVSYPSASGDGDTLGGGAFGNHVFSIGARGGINTYFDGRLYPLIIRGAQSNLSQIEAAERYIKQKMRLP